MILDINLLPKKLNEINYFKKTDDGCEIYSYNERIDTRNEVIVIKLDSEIENDFCVDSKALEMVKTLSPCEIEITDKSFIIKSKKGKYTSRLLSEMLFELNLGNDYKEIEVNNNILIKASGYVSKNDKKPILCSVRIDSNGNIFATDSFRAYLYNASFDLTTEGISLPVNFINSIKTLFNKDIINIKYNKNIAMVTYDNIKLYSRLIDGNYPDMKNIFLKKSVSSVVDVDYEELKDRISIASKVEVNEDKRTILKFSENKIEALGNDNYEAEIKFENDELYKNDYSLKVQLDLLDQSLKIMDSKTIFKVVYSNDKNGLMLFLDSEETNETCLILGIR